MVSRPGPAASGSAAKGPSALGPSECASRDRAEDAADAVKDMAKILNTMDPETVKRLVHAREAAAGVYKAFPEGDRRFDSVESESDDDYEQEVEGEHAVDEGNTEAGAAGEACRGLLDDQIYESPQACLLRAKEDYGFDVVAEMDKAELDFFERIRLVNYLRMVIDEGVCATEAVKQVRTVLKGKDSAVLADDKLLEPVIEGDLILTVLESEEDLEDAAKDKTDDLIGAVRDSLRAAHVLP